MIQVFESSYLRNKTGGEVGTIGRDHQDGRRSTMIESQWCLSSCMISQALCGPTTDSGYNLPSGCAIRMLCRRKSDEFANSIQSERTITTDALISTILISMALFFYTIGVWAERLSGRLKPRHLIFFWVVLLPVSTRWTWPGLFDLRFATIF